MGDADFMAVDYEDFKKNISASQGLSLSNGPIWK